MGPAVMDGMENGNWDGCSLSLPMQELRGITLNKQKKGPKHIQGGTFLSNTQLMCGTPRQSARNVPGFQKQPSYPLSEEKTCLGLQNTKTPFQLGNSYSHRSLEAGKVVLFFTVVNSPCSKTLGRYMLLATTGNRMVSPTVLSYNALAGLVFNFYIT